MPVMGGVLPALQSMIGAVMTGDVIQYFVVAQDIVAPPNVGINSGSFAHYCHDPR